MESKRLPRPITCLVAGIALIAAIVAPIVARADDPGPEILAAIRTERWADADAAAAKLVDPVGRKLVLYFRLLTPHAARAADIAAFMAESPDWPQQAVLSRRLAEALAVDGDERTVLEICQHKPPSAVPSLLRCADVDQRAGRSADAVASARQAWLTGIVDPATEAQFMRNWGRYISAEDQWRRFDRLAWTDTAAAARQLARLDPSQKPVGEVRLAFRRDDVSAPAMAQALPSGGRGDPALILEQARYFRRAGLDDDARRIWMSAGHAAEASAAADRRAAFWAERNVLVRRRLKSGDAAGAYAVASDHAQTETEQVADAEFLAGWIALRRLKDTERAERHFRRLAEVSKAAITQGRAHYWLGRTAALRGDEAAAKAEYGLAARWPTTYYGQLASRALGESEDELRARIQIAGDPTWDSQRGLQFAGREVARAAALLVVWGDPGRARSFVLRLDDIAPDETDRAMAARFALGLGLPEQAVAIARRAGRDGLMLPQTGWPMPISPPGTDSNGLDAAVILGLIRQESSFDIQAQSPVGARGLMQLMPGTAQAVARKIGEPMSLPALTSDAAYNMRLGTAYLRGLLDQFGGALPYAIAGYNAGPGRVLDWLASNGDPATGVVDMIDWIELIPFNETRNYVQRVIENVVIYRIQSKAATGHPLDRWLG